MKETLEEVAEKYEQDITSAWSINEHCKSSFIDGAKWKQERSYSEEEVLKIITSCKEYLSFGDEFDEIKWFEQFKKK